MKKFSLFLLERPVGHEYMQEGDFVKRTFEFIKTYNTLEEAEAAQKMYKQKTIILPSYGI